MSHDGPPPIIDRGAFTPRDDGAHKPLPTAPKIPRKKESRKGSRQRADDATFDRRRPRSRRRIVVKTTRRHLHGHDAIARETESPDYVTQQLVVQAFEAYQGTSDRSWPKLRNPRVQFGSDPSGERIVRAWFTLEAPQSQTMKTGRLLLRMKRALDAEIRARGVFAMVWFADAGTDSAGDA